MKNPTDRRKVGVAALAAFAVAGLVWVLWPAGERNESGTIPTTPAPVGPAAPDVMSPVPASEPPNAAAPALAKQDGSGVIRGTVFDANGSHAGAAQIHVVRRASVRAREAVDVPGEDAADENGRFAISGLAWGFYGVLAKNDTSTAFGAVQLSPQRPIAELTLVLTDSAAIAGNVVDESGTPVPDAEIIPITHEGDDITYSEQAQLRASSDASGAFQTLPLPLGKWVLCIRAAGFAQTLSPPIEAGTRDARIVLTRGTSLRGVAVDTTVAAPRPGLRVTLADKGRRLTPETVTTDAAGEFLFNALTPGAYTLVPDDGAYVCVDGALTVEVPEGGLDDVELRVAKGGSISGSVIDTHTREGIPDIEVSAYARGGNGSAQARSATTDEIGEFIVSGVAPGDVQLSPSVLPGMSRSLSDKERPTVRVEPGQTYTGIVIELQRGLAISGSVVDDSDEPVSGACVSAEGRPSARAYTDESGRFALLGFAENDETYLLADTGGDMSGLEGPFVVPAGGLSNVTLKLKTPRTASISGVVVDNHGVPQRVYVNAWPTDQELSLSFTSTRPMTRSDIKGRYALTEMPAGEYEMRLDRGTGGIIGRGVAVATITLRDGEAKRGVRLVLDSSATPSISGRVTDETGTPIASAKVSVESSGDQTSRQAQSDANGAFTVVDLPEGTCLVSVDHPAFLPQTVSDVQTGADDVLIVLQLKPTVTGTVIDAKTKEPIREFQVKLTPARGRLPSEFVSVSDPSGSFSLVAPFSSEWTVVVRARGYMEARVDAGEIEAGDISVTVPMEAGSSEVSGRVVTSSGGPVADALVFVDSLPQRVAERARTAAATTDAQGQFTIESLPVNGTTIYAWKDGFSAGSVFVTPGQAMPPQIVLPLAGSIRGTVTFDGSPIERAVVSAFGEGESGSLGSVFTDGDGRFELHELAPGTITLRVLVNLPGTEPRREQVTAQVSGGSITERDIAVSPSVTPPAP